MTLDAPAPTPVATAPVTPAVTPATPVTPVTPVTPTIDEEVPLPVVEEEETVEIEDIETPLANTQLEGTRVWWSWLPLAGVVAAVADKMKTKQEEKEEKKDEKDKE